MRDACLFFDVDGAGLVIDGPAMRERPTLVLLSGGPGFDHTVFKPAFAQLADRVGQSAGHRSEGPRTDTRRTGGQVQGRHRTVGSGMFPAAGATALTLPSSAEMSIFSLRISMHRMAYLLAAR